MNIMSHKGFNARIMKAQRLTGGVHGLPPGTPIDVYPVDAFEQPLPHWIGGAGNYVVPVKSFWGLWFDWTQNDAANTAILPTVKGMNPITGQRTNGFALERYESKCPVHDIEFSDGLYCKECDFKWPPQNYIAYPNIAWWDGFRTGDGKVRQFFFTEDLAKSIPELVIGKEDTVPAFGFAFYKPKTPRVFEQQQYRGGIICSGSTYNVKSLVLENSGSIGLGSPCPDTPLYLSENSTAYYSSAVNAPLYETKTSGGPICAAGGSSVGGSMRSRLLKSSFTLSKTVAYDSDPHEKKPEISYKAKAEVGVGAGAEISQNITVDPLKVSDWEETPSATMRLYFIFVEQFKEISSHGLKNLTGVKEGYLQGLPVG